MVYWPHMHLSYRKAFKAIMLGILLLPALGHAMSEQPFGGRQVMVLDESTCNCSGTNIHYLMDDTTNSELKLQYLGGRLYENNDISSYSGQQLGTYGVGGEACYMISYPDCIYIDSPTAVYGSDPGTGTTLRTEPSSLADTLREFGGFLASAYDHA